MQILLSFIIASLAFTSGQVPTGTTQALGLQANGSVGLAGSSADALGPGFMVDDGRGTPYFVHKSDNICGLDEPRQLTSPAVVDYDALIAVTAESKKIKKDKIDPTSSEGITLMTKARARVLKACESVRANQGHCSVWKKIKRRDKRAIDDITDDVKRLL